MANGETINEDKKVHFQCLASRTFPSYVHILAMKCDLQNISTNVAQVNLVFLITKQHYNKVPNASIT